MKKRHLIIKKNWETPEEVVYDLLVAAQAVIEAGGKNFFIIGTDKNGNPLPLDREDEVENYAIDSLDKR